MLKIKINRTDEKRIAKKLNNLSEAAANKIPKVILDEARIVASEMKDEVPVDTGRLQRNIKAVKKGKYVVISSEAISVGGHRFDYAPLIENYGGRFSKGIHYFTRGLNRLRNRLRNGIRNEFKNILRGRAGSYRQRGKTGYYTPPK